MIRGRLAGAWLCALVAAALATPGPAHASSTTTPLRMTAPRPANATVAGFRLSLVRARGASASRALARLASTLPRDITVFAVIAKQTRSDRVNGVIVAVNRAEAVAASTARPAARTLTVTIRHGRVPRGYRITARVAQSANVLTRHRRLLCSHYFRSSDLRHVQQFGGPAVRGISMRTLVRAACASARSSAPYPAEARFRFALNARAGTLKFTRSGSSLTGTASFNYPVAAFAIRADKRHHFTRCVFAAGTCRIRSTRHRRDYAVFHLSSSPAPRYGKLTFALTTSPRVKRSAPFEFFGVNQAGTRFGPLLTSGP